MKEIYSSKNNNKHLMKLTPDQVNQHQMNNSVTKMQYSFSKSKRFEETKQDNYKFYNLPDLKSRRYTTFGEGKRTQIVYKNDSPPKMYSCQYNLKRSNAFSFGLGRSDIKINNFIPSSSTPGPGIYTIDVNNEDVAYTIGKSNKIDFLLKEFAKMPGPDKYQNTLTNLQGKQKISKFPNIAIPKIIPSSNKRIKTQFTSPGPARYNPECSRMGKSPLGKQKYNGFSFGTSKRKQIAKTQKIPGPGQYQYFSQFIN